MGAQEAESELHRPGETALLGNLGPYAIKRWLVAESN